MCTFSLLFNHSIKTLWNVFHSSSVLKIHQYPTVHLYSNKPFLLHSSAVFCSVFLPEWTRLFICVCKLLGVWEVSVWSGWMIHFDGYYLNRTAVACVQCVSVLRPAVLSGAQHTLSQDYFWWMLGFFLQWKVLILWFPGSWCWLFITVCGGRVRKWLC